MSADPSILDHFCVIVNTSHETLNGQCCLVSSFDPSKSRYTASAVTSIMPATKRTLQLKAENLQPASSMEQKKYQYMKLKPYELLQDPKYAEVLRNAFQLQTELTSVASSYGLNLSILSKILPVLLLLHTYFFGFIKTFLLVTLITYPIIFSLPSLRLNKPILQCIKSIPLNLSTELTRATGYNVSSSLATIGLAGFYGMGVYTYFKSGGTKVVGGGVDQGMMERIYAKGYDDGSAGKPFGTSLEESVGSGSDVPYDDLGSVAPPPATGLGALGFTHLMSAGLIVKAGYDLGKGTDGVWNPANIVPNGKANPMRLMMPAFGMYRILKALGVL
ncbi:hypothetical protein TrST_g11397 [Triparma strigata]|uniref:Uncharacterized protein n=1 Tax=Triparma strigata TaxID=1606541 RepID=A0A9W7ASJ6_9STRA|nr:hypothetical protein TrST_g11397 [Triparma strigata]